MIAETNDQSQLQRLRKNKDESYTPKSCKHIPTGFALAIYYIEDIKCQKINILGEKKIS